jgi:hypothetical protein
MKRVREIDLEAPVPEEDDDGEDDGDGEDTVNSAWKERAFTKKGRWLHDVPRQGPKAEKQAKDPAFLHEDGNAKFQDANNSSIKAEHLANDAMQEQTSHTSNLRTAIDFQKASVLAEPVPRKDHEKDGSKVNKSAQLTTHSGVQDVQMTEASEQGVEEAVTKEHSDQLKEEKRISSIPPAMFLYSRFHRQDRELHSVLKKQAVLLSQADVSVRLEGVCLIGQNVELIKESSTRKYVTEVIEQQLFKEKERSVIEALVKVLGSIASIACAEEFHENNTNWASYVARLFLQYMTGKEKGGSLLNSTLKLQLLRTLYLVGQDGANLEFESVWPLSREQLASSNPRLREYGIRVLVQSIKERQGSNGRGLEATRDVQLSRAEGESMMDTLLKYTRDPYPTVREAVVSCVLSLHSKGFPLKHSTYKAAISLLGDKFESVRLSAVKLMGAWANSTDRDIPEGPDSSNVDNAFLQISNMMTDMNMSVRQEACSVLGQMTCVSDNVMLQSLTKKVLATSVTETGSKEEGSASMSNGNLHVAKLQESKLLEWATGAFVVGLEDEFWEVSNLLFRTTGIPSDSSSRCINDN